jgi:hypothetical protein
VLQGAAVAFLYWCRGKFISPGKARSIQLHEIPIQSNLQKTRVLYCDCQMMEIKISESYYRRTSVKSIYFKLYHSTSKYEMNPSKRFVLFVFKILAVFRWVLYCYLKRFFFKLKNIWLITTECAQRKTSLVCIDFSLLFVNFLWRIKVHFATEVRKRELRRGEEKYCIWADTANFDNHPAFACQRA